MLFVMLLYKRALAQFSLSISYQSIAISQLAILVLPSSPALQNEHKVHINKVNHSKQAKFLYNSTNYCTIQQIIVQCNKLLYKSTNYCTMQQIIVQCNNFLYNSTNYCTMQQIIVQFNKLLYN